MLIVKIVFNYINNLLFQGSNGDNREVNRLRKKEYFGELGLLSKKPRAASVFAVGETRCAGEYLHTSPLLRVRAKKNNSSRPLWPESLSLGHICDVTF